ncbi:MAG: Thiol:disulfide interchange protein DsbD precursor [Planctomycetota bacterium]|jgi:thiol:disulfide interchange protein DsbD
MRSLGRLAVFPLSLLLLAASAAAAHVPQNPPKIPGLPSFAKPAKAEPPAVFGNSQDQVEVAVEVLSPKVVAGADCPIAVTFRIWDGYHIWTRGGSVPEGMAEFDGAIRTEIAFNPDDSGKPKPIAGIALNEGFMQWPEAHGVESDLGEGKRTYAVYEGVCRVYIPASIARDAQPGMVTIPLEVTFQACNDTQCSAPATVELEAKLEIVSGAAPAASAGSAAFSGFDPAVYARVRSGEKPSEELEFNLFSWTFSIDPSGAGFLLLLAIAAAGGLLLNFTPCVLPVIPLKIMGLSQAAQGSRTKCFMLGFVMSLGVVAFWMALGLAIASIKGFETTNQLFQKPEFTIAVGVIIAVMAIGMAGFFSLKLPDWIYMVEAKHDSYSGSFLFGIMTAVLSTPCTAPLMGTAVAWATTQGPATILTVFAAVGTGMALPYLVLSAKPEWLDKMPRSGPASDLIKQVMGLLLLAAAAYFVGAGVSGLLVTPPEPPSHAYWWVVSVLGTAAGAWLAWRTLKLTDKAGNRVMFGGLGVAILAISVLIGLSQTAKGPVDWTYYTPERLATAQKAGKVVVVDFTAEWCANCKTLEALVLNTPAVSKELNADDVEPIKVDLTGNNTDGNALLKASNRVTIPLLLIYARDGSLVLNATEYTPAQVLAAIEEARKKGAIGG